MKVCCDEIKINTEVGSNNKTNNNKVGEAIGAANMGLFKILKVFVNDQIKDQLNQKKW